MPEWTLTENAKPRPHSRYLLRRDGYFHTVTPCYGMHAPWWVPTAISGQEYEPVAMLDTDEWMPLQPGPTG